MKRRFWFAIAAFALTLPLLGAATLIDLTNQVQGILRVANGGTGNSTGQATLSNVSSSLSAPVTLNAATYTDGPSVSITAGTWLVVGEVELQTTSTASIVNFSCKLWDGTTVVAASYVVRPALASAAVTQLEVPLSGVMTEAGSATAKISCISTTNNQLIEAAPANNSPGNFSSKISALQIQ